MSNFKTRVEGLMSSTSSDQAVAHCKDALKKYSEYSHFKLSTAVTEQFELAISESLVKDLENITDNAVQDFLTVEKRIIGMANLGVKKTIHALKESELVKNPATLYMVEGLTRMENSPEWMTIQAVIEHIKPYAFHAIVKEHLNILESNAAKYAEDIKIYAAVYEAKNSRSSFILDGVQKDIDSYLNSRTAANRTKLIESLNRYNYDGGIRKIYNAVLESERSFQLKATSNDAVVKKVYSPVIVMESSEIFSIYGKAYTKEGNNVRPLSEDESKNLPGYFNWLSHFLAQPNVEISENKIKVFSYDKKVEIIEEAEGLNIAVNGKTVTAEEFHNIYLKAGMFRANEREIIDAVNKIVEKWDIIMELDFAKTIFPKGATHRRVDVMNLGNKMHIATTDASLRESKFYGDCNATQSRNLVLEFASYDLGNNFTSVLSREEAEVRKIEEQRKTLLGSIEYLQNKKAMLENHPDAEIRESEEVKEIVSVIDEELSNVKAEYLELQNKIKGMTHVKEGVGANVGDEVEHLKKKQ